MNGCRLCSGAERVFCRTCYAPIARHTHEGDYICDDCGCVDAVTEMSLRALKARLDALSHVEPSRDHGEQ